MRRSAYARIPEEPLCAHGPVTYGPTAKGRHDEATSDRAGRLRRLSEQTRRGELAHVLSDLPPPTDPGVLIDFRTSDDAGVYRWPGGPALVQTVDFFTPIVDDPFTYGQIAAANSLSDVYAMGGTPVTALAIAGLPDKASSTRRRSGRSSWAASTSCARPACALLGGHTVRDPEVKFGYAVTGAVDPDRIWTNAGARAGDRLILTKSLGTGIVGTAIKKGSAHRRRWSTPRCASMTMLNKARGRRAAPVRRRRARLHRHHRLRPDRPRDRDGRRKRRDDRDRRPRACPCFDGVTGDCRREPIRRPGHEPRALRADDDE